MNHSIKHIFILILFVLPFSGIAQKDSVKHDTVKAITNKNELSVNGNISIGMGLGYDGDHGTSIGPDYGTQTPVYNGNIDYGIEHDFSLGVAIAYQQYTYTDVSQMTFDYTHNTTTLNLSARVLYYIQSSKKVELYCGLSLGTCFIRDNLTSSTNQSSITNSAPLIGDGLIGVRFIGKFSGIYLEGGIGSAPYYIEGGLTFRI